MKTFLKTWNALIHNKKYLLLTALLEILFLASLIQLQFVFFTPMIDAEYNTQTLI